MKARSTDSKFVFDGRWVAVQHLVLVDQLATYPAAAACFDCL